MTLDAMDEAILRELQEDGRVSWRELGERVQLSAPAVRDRVKVMERDGVITGYSVRVDPARLGMGLRAIIRLNEPYTAGSDRKVDGIVAGLPEVIECHRVTGSESHVLRALLADTGHLEEMLEQLWPYASSITNIVTSSPVPRRSPPVSLNRPAPNSPATKGVR